MSELTTLDIHLHGRQIGTLTRLPNDKVLLSWSRNYLTDTQRPTLSLSFKDEMGELIEDFRPTGPGLMPWFSNMLPEGRLRDYLASKASVKPEREFFLLWALGRDLPGAVDIRPADGEPRPAWKNASLPERGEPDGPLRFSLAGIQLKFSALMMARGGLTIPAYGMGGDWIVKLPSLEFEGVSENEFSMMTLARMLGMDVPDIRLLEVDDIENLPPGLPRFKGQAYAIRRYDRLTDGQQLHQEDFAQIFSLRPAQKYERVTYRRIVQVLAIEGNSSDIVEFIRRLVFNVLIGNADMHAKNWSVVYPDQRQVKIAPAYDFVSTIAYMQDEKMALKASRTARFDEFNLDELAHMAGKAMLPERLILNTAKETVASFRDVWAREKHNLPLAKSIIAKIETHLTSVPIYGEE